MLLPWSFGGVDAFSQYLMFLPLVLSAAACLLRIGLSGAESALLPVVAIPAAVLVLGGIVQTQDVGEEMVARISPQVAAWRRDLSGRVDGVEGSSASDSSPQTLSVYPPATRKETSLLLAGLAVLLIASQVFRQPRDLLWLSGALSINGAALAYFGIVQKLSWNGQLFWVVPPGPTVPFGPFVNRNAAGGYFVLCLAAAIPLLTHLAFRWQARRISGASVVWPARRPWWTPPSEVLGLSLVALLVLLFAGLLAAMSRGAWLGAVVGAAAALAITWRSWFRRTGLVGVLGLLGGLVAATGLLIWLNLDSEVGERLATLTEGADALRGRSELWWDVLRMVPDFWRCGSGLGTFGLVQPMYQTGPMRVWYDQAENIFLQALAEAGVAGAVLVTSLIPLALWSARPLWREQQQPFTIAVGAMAVTAVMGQAACASFDFSLRFPANQWALALIVGATLGFAGPLRAMGPSSAARSSWPRRLAGVGLYASLLVGLLLAWWEVAWAGGVDLALVRGQAKFDEATMSAEELEDTLVGLETLLRRRPDDAEAHLRIAGLHIIRYRHAAWQQLQDELGEDATKEELWTLTSPIILHQRASEFALTGDTASLDELRAEPVIQTHLVPALQAALRAREYGPFFHRVHQDLTHLAFLAGDPLNESVHIARAIAVVPQDPEVRFWAGRMHLDSGRLSDAAAQWQACLRLMHEHDEEILATLAERTSTPLLINELLPPSVDVLTRIAGREFTRQAEPEFRRLLGERLLDAVSAAPVAGPPGLDEFARGRAYELLGDLERSVEHTQRATALSPQRTEWRMQLALLHREAGDLGQAVREAETCVRLNPAHQKARQLLERLLSEARNRGRRTGAP